jgi:UTP--glucose-1-phosphate uridylyltransferase
VHAETGASVVGVREVPPGQEHHYGVVAGNPEGPGRVRVTGLVEKPAAGTAPSRMAIVGRYVLDPAIWPLLARGERGAGGEIQLTDAMKGLIGQRPGLLSQTLRGRRHDAGDRLGYLQANIEYALARPTLREPLLAFLREVVGRG